MAALALSTIENMANISPADLRRILDAITALDRTTQSALGTLNISVAGLDIKVAAMTAQVGALASEVKEKASRLELASMRAEIDKDLKRVEDGVKEDTTAFQGMYESVMVEVREMREKVENMSKKIDRITDMDERLKKLEPIRDEIVQGKGFIDGAKWAVHAIWAVVGAGVAAALIKMFGGGASK